MRRRLDQAILIGFVFVCLSCWAGPGDYFGIQVVDEQTGRGVPMVELKTTSCLTFYTDSGGWIAFNEPGLMNKAVWFGITSHGYEFPADGFGLSGKSLKTKPGTTAILKIKRLNIAERIYRITGAGIYRDTVLLGRKPPIAQPLLNADVTGQDTVLTAIYRGKLFWFYGDTEQISYGLGNYQTTGATSLLPNAIQPEVGFDLHYFTGSNGFTKRMIPLHGEGVVWLTHVLVLPDETGRERMVTFYQRRRGLGAVLESGYAIYDDATDQFKPAKPAPLNPPWFPDGHPFRIRETNGVEYIYFSSDYPTLRVRADWKSYFDLSSYEGYTCLKPDGALNRDHNGKLVWAWQKNTRPLEIGQQEKLIQAGRMKRSESPFRLEDAATHKPVRINNCSCFWNEYRRRYVMIASESMGATVLGEVWYAEANRPEGPWVAARKIITHANKPHDAHDFYNPTQHPFFDQDGGRVIYLEGSYVNTFSGNHQTTPNYEYNQIMYRLDLSDPRLQLN